MFDVRRRASESKDCFSMSDSSRALPVCLGWSALILACIGLYGLLLLPKARAEPRRFGVRTALGAQTYEVLRLIANARHVAGLRRHFFWSYRIRRSHPVLEACSTGVQPTDPYTFFAVALLLLIVGGAACLILPAAATRVDPSLLCVTNSARRNTRGHTDVFPPFSFHSNTE